MMEPYRDKPGGDDPDSGAPRSSFELPPCEADSAEIKQQAARLLDRLFGVLEPTTMSRYRLEDELGRGAMGIVYRAKDQKLGRVVAIKTVLDKGDEVLKRALLTEARRLAQITHANVVTIHDLGESEEDLSFIVMEYIDGVDLKALQTREALSRADVLELFYAAGKGLQAAHEAGLVHRDFKPSNVMVSADRSRVCVLDFGLAVADLCRDRTLQAEESSFVGFAGTPRYMAPEQASGVWVAPRSDQFAYCVALYEAVCRRHPFAGMTLAQRVGAAERGEVQEPPRDVPKWLERVLRRGLAPRPEGRHASMKALLAALEAEGGEPEQSRVRAEIVFSRSHESFDEQERERLQNVLRLITLDEGLEILWARPGSLRVGLSTRPRGLERLCARHRDGALAGRLGQGKILRFPSGEDDDEQDAATKDEPAMNELAGFSFFLPRSRAKTGGGRKTRERTPDTASPTQTAETAAHKLSDAVLFRAYKDGDQGAGAELFKRYHAAISRYFMRQVGGNTDDLVQATFEGLFRLTELRGEANIRSLLFRIAYNKFVEHLKKTSRQRALFDPMEHSIRDSGLTPSQLLERKDEQRLLLAALARLPVSTRTIVELRYAEDLSIVEIAETMGMQAVSIKARLHRAKSQLRTLVEVLASSPSERDGTFESLSKWED